jgi:hypothetical protein
MTKNKIILKGHRPLFFGGRNGKNLLLYPLTAI